MLGPQEISFRHFGDTSSSLWGGSILKSTWKEFENVLKHFLTKFLQVKKQTPYTLLLLEMGSLPIEIMAMEMVVEYMDKIQKSPSHLLPRIAWEARKNIQKTHKSNIWCSGWMQDIEKWFGRWDARHLLHDASLDSLVNEAFLQVREFEYHTYNGLPLFIFHHAFHISSTEPNPCTNFSHNHNVRSQLQHSLVKFLNIESRYSLSHVSCEM